MKLLKNLSFQADDFGYDNSSSSLMLRLKKEKKIINFSVIPNLLGEKTKRVEFTKNKKVAVHINFIEGKSTSRLKEIPSLVDKKGYFYPLPVFIARLFLGRISLEEIYKESESQIDFLKRKRVIITELNSHQHLHALSPIADIFFTLAKKNNIKFVRSYKNIYTMTTIARIKHLALKTLAYTSEIIFNKKLRLPKSWMINDQMKTVFMSWESEKFQFNKLDKISRFKIVVHPGLPFDSNKTYLKTLDK